MTIKFEYTLKALELDDINRFENNLNLLLPEDYKSFLLAHNGGKPKKRRFKTFDETITTSIMFFFPLSDETESNLSSVYTKYNLNLIYCQ